MTLASRPDQAVCPCCGRVVPWWPEEDMEQLRQFCARGLTGGQIAIKFRGRYTRAAILAKIARMGLRQPAMEQAA